MPLIVPNGATRMSLPLLRLRGSPYEQGRQQGEALRERIAHNVALYFARFAGEVRLDRREVLARAERYLAAIEAHSPAYYTGMRGVADGCGRDRVELAALNVRYEILYYQFGANAMADGCTAIAVTPEVADGRLLIGQNWDWIPGVQGALLHTVESDGLETLSFTEAGIFGGKIGLNSAGLGLAVNGITTTDDDWSRLSAPFHVRCYEILRAYDLDAAIRVVADAPRACSTNFIIAQAPGRAVNIEAVPDRVRTIAPDGGCLVHTNHLLDPDALGVAEPPSELRPGSCQRLARMKELLHATRPVTLEGLQDALRDHDGYPFSICRHADTRKPPTEQYTTVLSALMDLEARAMYISDGPPCERGYQRIRLV
jgi:isopenicillin-N N-acyltransferase like protein